MRILFVAAEGAPFVKTGGLGDVIGSLPRALKQLGLEVGVIMPKYQDIPEEYQQEMTLVKTISVQMGWQNKSCGIEMLTHHGVSFYFIDHQHYFKRQGCYGYQDDGERYSFFSQAVVEAIPHLDFQPDIVHCHDWHGGMVSVLLAAKKKLDPTLTPVRTVFTIHNLKYQGIFPKEILGELLSLDDSYFTIDGVEFYGGVSFMKGGIGFADLVTTVSKTYAEEIQHPHYGERLEGLLRKKSSNLFGIVNGIDYEEFNPAADPHIFAPYDSDSLDEKQVNKMRLKEQLGLSASEVPLVGIVSRLVEQKGMDLIGQVLEEIMAQDVQLVVLGTGEGNYEEMFRQAALEYPGKLSVNLLYDDSLAHRIYAGADFFLMPSLFEPCGLSQLMAMRYGTIPIVRETGGLKDTVAPYQEETGTGSGFTFAGYNPWDMLYTIKRAISFYQQEQVWTDLRKKVMSQDYSWSEPAQVYQALYRQVLKRNI